MNPKAWVKSEYYKMLCEDPYFDKDDMYPLSGIYKIENKENGKIYIGQSKDVVKRILTHKTALRNGKHYNSYLQRAWNIHGEDNFSFEVIENVEVEHLTHFENHFMELYESYNEYYGYNQSKPSENLESYSMSERTKIKLSEARTEYTDEELLSFIHEFYYHNGRVPVSRDMMKRDGYPSRGTYDIRFGNFKNALIEAGLYDLVENKKLFERKEYTKDEVLSEYRSFIEKEGRFPTGKDQKDTRITNLPTQAVVIKHFKSMENLKKELGYGKEEIINKENTEALEMLKELYIQDGKVTARSIDKSRITRSAGFYRDRFGSLAKACEMADIPYALHT